MTSLTIARQLIGAAHRASLGTIQNSPAADGGPVPYVSLVTVAPVDESTLVTLLSGLARHTQNLNSSGHCSLLISDDGAVSPGEDPMAASRITLTAVAERLQRGADQSERDRFLELHPQASVYADFGDFAFFRLRVTEAHLVAGFGRIQTWTAQELREDGTR